MPTVFTNKIRHTINFTSEENLIIYLKKIMEPNKMTAIRTSREIIYVLSPIITNTFTGANLVYAPTKLIDEQTEIIKKTLNIKHRGYKNIMKEIFETHYWPETKQQ